jgi:hypothetical protein
VVVRASSVVLVMAAELGVQGFLLLVDSIVPVLFAPFPDCLQPSTKPLGNCLHVIEGTGKHQKPRIPDFYRVNLVVDLHDARQDEP